MSCSSISCGPWDTKSLRSGTSFSSSIRSASHGARSTRRTIDARIVSNHGGRAEDNGLTTIEGLPEVVRAVDGRIPVMIDSGFRRGTDVFKALARGASAVCIGRPYVWGLAGFGQQGVEGALAILRVELETIMRQMGTPDLASITPERLRTSG